MAKKTYSYAIDDSLGTAENLAAFDGQLAAFDGPLAVVLGPHLEVLAAGHEADLAAIWNALYAATEQPGDAGVAIMPDGEDGAA